MWEHHIGIALQKGCITHGRAAGSRASRAPTMRHRERYGMGTQGNHTVGVYESRAAITEGSRGASEPEGAERVSPVIPWVSRLMHPCPYPRLRPGPICHENMSNCQGKTSLEAGMTPFARLASRQAVRVCASGRLSIAV
jgi:hypothetical protein